MDFNELKAPRGPRPKYNDRIHRLVRARMRRYRLSRKVIQNIRDRKIPDSLPEFPLKKVS